MRMKRGSNDSLDLQAMLSGELSPPSAAHRTFSASSAASAFYDGGSWSKVSKRRVESMTLQEVSAALASTVISPASPEEALLDDALGMADLAALDALCSAEFEAEAALPSDEEADRFVDAVFGDQLLDAPHAELRDGRPSAAEEAAEEALFESLLRPHEALYETELDQDELLAMLHTKASAEALTSPSPKSIVTLFDATLAGGASPGDEEERSPAMAKAPAVFHSEVAQKLEELPQTTSKNAETSRNGAERKEWTAAEDEIIRTSVEVHGCRWRRIAAQLPGRSDDAVRNRWNRLKGDKEWRPGSPAGMAWEGLGPAPVPPPASKRTASSSSEGGSKPERVSWTRIEDATILQSVQELGHKWNKLAERLPGRTDHAIRNRYHRLQTMMEDTKKQQQPRSPSAFSAKDEICFIEPMVTTGQPLTFALEVA